MLKGTIVAATLLAMAWALPAWANDLDDCLKGETLVKTAPDRGLRGLQPPCRAERSRRTEPPGNHVRRWPGRPVGLCRGGEMVWHGRCPGRRRG